MEEEKYHIRKDQIQDEQGNVHIVYGVEVPSEGISIPDIFFDEDQATQFVFLCNSLNLSTLHIIDVVNDLL